MLLLFQKSVLVIMYSSHYYLSLIYKATHQCHPHTSWYNTPCYRGCFLFGKINSSTTTPIMYHHSKPSNFTPSTMQSQRGRQCRPIEHCCHNPDQLWQERRQHHCLSSLMCLKRLSWQSYLQTWLMDLMKLRKKHQLRLGLRSELRT